MSLTDFAVRAAKGRFKPYKIADGGGLNCYPAEIENILLSHPAVAEAAVIGIADERLGEVGKAFIVPKGGCDLKPEAIVTWCRANMANYKVPRMIEFREFLPRTASGKVEKFRLSRVSSS